MHNVRPYVYSRPWLYQIKDEYGASMHWLHVMLGSWHTLKDYLGVFFKKHRHTFLQTTLKECFSGNTLEGILKVSEWNRSHNFAIWIFEALVRHLIESILNNSTLKETQLQELRSSIQSCVEVLQKDDISEEDVKLFSSLHNHSVMIMENMLPDINLYITL